MTVGRNNTTSNKDWCTPIKYTKAINDFFNDKLKLDPCSNPNSIIKADIKFELPTDGLKQDWNYSTIYVNPPYGRDKERKTTIKNWIQKIYETYSKYNNEILALIPVATNTSHWKLYIFGKATGVCFLYDTRLKFRINGNENNKGSPMACAMGYWGKDYDKFKNIFGRYGYIANIKY